MKYKLKTGLAYWKYQNILYKEGIVYDDEKILDEFAKVNDPEGKLPKYLLLKKWVAHLKRWEKATAFEVILKSESDAIAKAMDKQSKELDLKIKELKELEAKVSKPKSKPKTQVKTN